MSEIAAVVVSAQTVESAPVEFNYTFGNSLADMVSIFGEDVVTAKALNGLTVAVQGHARGLIRAGKTAEEIVTAMETWKPGSPRVAKSPEDKARELLAALPAEQRDALLKELRAKK